MQEDILVVCISHTTIFLIRSLINENKEMLVLMTLTSSAYASEPSLLVKMYKKYEGRGRLV